MKASRSLYTSFSQIFPPPQFLEMPTAGLDISDKAVRFVELQHHGSHLYLRAFGEEPLSPGVIQDGTIEDSDGLTKALYALKRTHGLHFVRVSLPEEESYIFRTSIPCVKETNIQEAIQFRIEENVPLSPPEAIYDYRVVSQPKPGDTTMAITITVVPKKVVLQYIDILAKADLIPLALETESQAITRAALPLGTDETYILIAIRETRTVLSLVSQGEIQFTSTLAIGGETIATSIKKNLNVTEGEVERIRRGKELRESNEMFLSLVSAATALRDEIQKLTSYWQNNCQEFGLDPSIKGIILSGSDATLGIDDYLSRSLDMHVQLANPWVNILSVQEDVPPLLFREALDFIPALGLALP